MMIYVFAQRITQRKKFFIHFISLHKYVIYLKN